MNRTSWISDVRPIPDLVSVGSLILAVICVMHLDSARRPDTDPIIDTTPGSLISRAGGSEGNVLANHIGEGGNPDTKSDPSPDVSEPSAGPVVGSGSPAAGPSEPDVRSGQEPEDRASQGRLVQQQSGNSQSQESENQKPQKSLYAARTREDRSNWIQEQGGSPQSEQAVQAGLNWLARHQAADGSWSDQARCEDTTCSTLNFNAPAAPIAQTGLAILAFQAGGHYAFNDTDYSDTVRRGLDWLVSRQQKDGCLLNSHTWHSYAWYEHGIATFALAEACAVAIAEGKVPKPEYETAARLAASFIEQGQYTQGGWRYSRTDGGLGDTSVTGWQMLALKSAIEAKFEIAPETVCLARQFFERATDASTGTTAYVPRGRCTNLTTSVGVVVQKFFGDEPDPPMVQKASTLLQGSAATLGKSGDFYTLYNATLAMFLVGGEAWRHWNDVVRDAVIARQANTGCCRGSWSGNYSRTLATAWAALTLEVYYRYERQSQSDKRHNFDCENVDLSIAAQNRRISRPAPVRRKRPAPRSPDQVAASSFALAKDLLEVGKKKQARDWLQEIVKKFPDTPAAKDAQELIKKIGVAANETPE